jgi:hypothetical protein
MASPFFHAVIAALAVSNPSRLAAFSKPARRLDWRRDWVVSPFGLVEPGDFGIVVILAGLLDFSLRGALGIAAILAARIVEISHVKTTVIINFCFHWISPFVLSNLVTMPLSYHRYITLSRVDR